jgi:hypothetical protein
VVGAKHLPRYLGAFAWRFNRRFVLKTIHERTSPDDPRIAMNLAFALARAGKRREAVPLPTDGGPARPGMVVEVLLSEFGSKNVLTGTTGGVSS